MHFRVELKNWDSFVQYLTNSTDFFLFFFGFFPKGQQVKISSRENIFSSKTLNTVLLTFYKAYYFQIACHGLKQLFVLLNVPIPNNCNTLFCSKP